MKNRRIEKWNTGADLEKPLHWRKPRVVLVDPHSDLFKPEAEFAHIANVYNIMACATLGCSGNHWAEDADERGHGLDCWTGESHIFQVLTKHSEQVLKFYEWLDGFYFVYAPGDTPLNIARDIEWTLPNVFIYALFDQKEEVG